MSVDQQVGLMLHHPPSLVVQGQPIQLVAIDTHTLLDFKKLNMGVFPVTYNADFYKNVLYEYPSQLSRLAKLNNQTIGAISCRREAALGESCRGEWVNLVYIMTLGVLAPYRRLALGSILLNFILDQCVQDPTISYLCLHVHVMNQAAIQFYMKFGFVITERLNGYYARNQGVEPPDAFFLVKRLHNRLNSI